MRFEEGAAARTCVYRFLHCSSRQGFFSARSIQCRASVSSPQSRQISRTLNCNLLRYALSKSCDTNRSSSNATKAEAPDRRLETPTNPSPKAVSRLFWRWFSETALQCPEADATSPSLFPGRLQTHHPEHVPMTIRRSPRQFRAGLPPDIRPTKSRGKCFTPSSRSISMF